jgi:hypothetical protein
LLLVLSILSNTVGAVRASPDLLALGPVDPVKTSRFCQGEADAERAEVEKAAAKLEREARQMRERMLVP